MKFKRSTLNVAVDNLMGRRAKATRSVPAFAGAKRGGRLHICNHLASNHAGGPNHLICRCRALGLAMSAGDSEDEIWWEQDQMEARMKIDEEQERVRQENEAATRWGRERQKASLERSRARKKEASWESEHLPPWKYDETEYLRAVRE